MRKAAIVLAIVLAAGGAAADKKSDEARRLYRIGEEQFKAGRIELAIKAFEEGYALDPRPEFLLNLAQSHRALGQRKVAIDYLERFIAAAPTHAYRPAAEKTLAELRRAESEEAPPPFMPPRPKPTPSPSAPARPIAPPPHRPEPSRAWVWIAAGAAVVLAGSVTTWIIVRDDGPEVIDTVVVPPP